MNNIPIRKLQTARKKTASNLKNEGEAIIFTSHFNKEKNTERYEIRSTSKASTRIGGIPKRRDRR